MSHVSVAVGLAMALAAGLVEAAAEGRPLGRQGELRDSAAIVLCPETTRRIEEQLQAAGLDPGPVDGLVSQETFRALREFQGRRGLHVSGALDEATRRALLPGGLGGPTAEGCY